MLSFCLISANKHGSTAFCWFFWTVSSSISTTRTRLRHHSLFPVIASETCFRCNWGKESAEQPPPATNGSRLLKFHRPTDNDQQSGEPGPDPSILAINVGAVKGDHSDDHYCMLDSGANVMVIPWKEGMQGDHTMCLGGR